MTTENAARPRPFCNLLPRLRCAAAALAALAALGLAPAAGAQPPTPLSPLTIEGDAAAGELLALTCTGCHAIPGYRNAYPSYLVPKLGGQNADYLEVALQGYRRGTRHHQTMQAQAASLSDQDIADLAAYFAGLPGDPATGVSAGGSDAVEAGRQKSVACAPCHGQAGKAEGPQWPNLAGQHQSYIIAALKQYREGGRADLFMGPMLSGLEEQDLEELAAYFSALPGLYVPEQ